ncbi:DUF4179 domain-containing protein [Peribacillus sp. SCS-155]|uniref:DUF4179 domain-containing protein n=1 Tax=Peribacillus sedimenti TaxID=3115297 RepID=UPI003905ACC0
MEKDRFYNEMNEVEVPKEAVLQSIKSGVNRAVQETARKKRKPAMKLLGATATAAAVLLAYSLSVPSFSRAMANAPVIGGLYAGFNDAVGRNLEKQNLVTSLNQNFSSNGVDVTVTSAYYDGNLIGITFDVKGEIGKDRNGYHYALYELFHGDPLADETKELTTLEKIKEGFTGHIRIVYPYKELPKRDTIPVSFKEIGEKQGDWQFEVPVTQNTVTEHVLDKESDNPEGQVRFKLDSVLYGKASTSITYRVTYRKGSLSVRGLNVETNLVLPISDGKIDEIHNGNTTTVVRRAVFTQVLKNMTVKVSPSYEETDLSPVEPLEIKLP